MLRQLLLGSLLLAIADWPVGANATAVFPTSLRVERLLEKEAYGIDTQQPQLSWAWTVPSGADRGASVPHSIVSVALAAEQLAETPLWQQTAHAVSSLQYTGPTLPSTTRVHWRVCIQLPAGSDTSCTFASFVTGHMHSSDWTGEWIAGRQLRSPTVVWPGRALRSAMLTVTGLGFYEIELNGKKVGDAVLDPGFSTNYTERILYSTFDVTGALNTTKAASLFARVGAGKYSYAVNPHAVPGKDVFALLAQLKLEFDDEKAPLMLCTNTSWQVSQSPIVWENLYNGEVYDARLEDKAEWAQAEIVSLPAGAHAALSARLFPPIRIVETVTPINETQLAARSFFYDLGNNYAGVARVTFNKKAMLHAGDRLVIVCTEYLNIASTPGGPADMYNQQDLYIASGNEEAGDTYAPTFVYHGFRYVRVDLISDSKDAVASEVAQGDFSVHGLFMHSDIEQHGQVSFAGASVEGAVLDAIHKMVVQTQRDNIHSHPTDCPQREKRGWMGDAQWTSEEAMLNFDMSAVYANWVRTMNDVQSTGCTVALPGSTGPTAGMLNMSGYCFNTTAPPNPDCKPGGAPCQPLMACNVTNSYCCLPTPKGADPKFPLISFCSPQYNQSDYAGSIPDVVPNNWGRGGSRGWPGAPTWSSAYVIIPATVLQYGHDVPLVEKHYDGIAAHVDFLARQAGYGDGVPQFGMLGDWCSVETFCPGSSDKCLSTPGWTSGDATSAFYYILDLQAMVQMAHAIGKRTDVAKYEAAVLHAKAAYRQVFFNNSSNDFGPTQTGNVLGILATSTVDTIHGAVERLVQNLRARSGHLSTGAVGTRWILQALTHGNRSGDALDLATQTSAPSWAWFTKNGPGTLHENWPTGPTPDGTTGGSQCHPMFGGGIDPWIYHEVGGVRPPPAAESVRFGIDPVIMRRVLAASVRTKIYGSDVASSWRYDPASHTLLYNCTVPVGVKAQLVLRAETGRRVEWLRESGAMVWSARPNDAMDVAGVGIAISETPSELRVPLGAGAYAFATKL